MGDVARHINIVLVGLNRPFCLDSSRRPVSLPDHKSQGHPLSGPFVEAHQGVHPHVCPCSGFLVASPCGCACPLVANVLISTPINRFNRMVSDESHETQGYE